MRYDLVSLSSGLGYTLLLVSILLASFEQINLVRASSRAPGPLKRIFHPRSISLQVIPRSIPSTPSNPHKGIKRSELGLQVLLPSDALRLTLAIPKYDGSETLEEEDRIHLHLRPSEDVLHPQAKINYLSSAGEIIGSEPLLSHHSSHRLYTGDVIAEQHTDKRMREDQAGGLWYQPHTASERGVRGYASIHIYEDGLKPGGSSPARFAGTIQVDGKVWNIMTRENYERHRGELDPAIRDVDGKKEDMVIFLEGDHHPAPSKLVKQDRHANSLCGHDALDYNINNNTHPVLQSRNSLSPSPWWIGSSDDVYLDSIGKGHLSTKRVIKRQDTPTGGTASSTNYANTINSTTGCPKEQRIVYVGFAADCNYVTTYGGAEQARVQILTNMNSVSTLYRETFNVSLGIIELNVVNKTCATSINSSIPWNTECSNTVTLNDRLSTFSQWRGQYGTADAGLYHLATSCATDQEIGVAWLGTVCQTTANEQSSGYVSGTGVSVATRSEWSLISHEMGHNFGAIHDCTTGCSLTGSCCPLSTSTCDANEVYIMNPSTSTSNPQVNFSPCSIGNICSLMQTSTLDYSCMVAPGGKTVLSLQSCGNGILETGEDCDPGANSTSACCDSNTCKFINGAVCDPATDACCSAQCSYASNSTICRAAIDSECDTAEYCTGSSRTCPADQTVSDGTSCGSGLACASGQCTSLDLQCQTVGATLNLTTACGQKGDRSCVVSCQTPGTSNQCLVLQSPLIDGSPCGYGGRCYNATCSSGSVNDTIDSWYKQNLQISIPVTIVGGIIILAILWSLMKCLCCGGCCGMGTRKGKHQSKDIPPQLAPITTAMRQNQRMSQGYPPPNIDGHYSPTYGSPPPQHPQSYGGYNQSNYQSGPQPFSLYPPAGYASPQQPPPIQAGREHYVDDRHYNGLNYRGH